MDKSKLEAPRARGTGDVALKFDDPMPRNGVSLLRGLGGPDIVGTNVVEVAPEYDPRRNAVQLAALLFEDFALMIVGRPA